MLFFQLNVPHPSPTNTLTCIKTATAYCYKSNSNVIMLLSRKQINCYWFHSGKKLQRIASRRQSVDGGYESYVMEQKFKKKTKLQNKDAMMYEKNKNTYIRTNRKESSR